MTVKDFCNMWRSRMWNATQEVQVVGRDDHVTYFDRWDIRQGDIS